MFVDFSSKPDIVNTSLLGNIKDEYIIPTYGQQQFTDSNDDLKSIVAVDDTKDASLCLTLTQTLSTPLKHINKDDDDDDETPDDVYIEDRETSKEEGSLTGYKEVITSQIKYHECLSCDKQFEYNFLLKQHMQSHTKELSCDQCGSVFTSLAALTHHTKHIHNKILDDRIRNFVCSVCGKAFLHKENLNQHARVHSDVKSFVCTVCGFSTKANSALNVHMRIHTDERSYQCKFCGKRYKSNSNLHIHMKTHTGEKGYQCKMCNKEFTTSSRLKRHMLTHGGNKKYKCEICNKSFSQNVHLKTHVKIHTGEKSYQCDICNKTFIEKQSLIRHMRIHTGEKPYQCKTCQKSFSTSYQ